MLLATGEVRFLGVVYVQDAPGMPSIWSSFCSVTDRPFGTSKFFDRMNEKDPEVGAHNVRANYFVEFCRILLKKT